MKKFRVHAEIITYMYIDVEANTKEEAEIEATQLDRNEFLEEGTYAWEYLEDFTEELD